jgi:hypothetical protein
VQEIQSFFYNKNIDDQTIFDGCLPLLLYCGVLKYIIEDKICVSHLFQNELKEVQSCTNAILTNFLLEIKKEDFFSDIFSSKNLSYSMATSSVVIRQSAFGFKYSNVRKFLIDFAFLQRNEALGPDLLTINKDFNDFFETNFATIIRTQTKSLEDLKKELLKREENGLIAEQFVLGFESKRLNCKKGIRWIAPFNVNAGYDILSFQAEDSASNDMYIEVKGYSGETPYFYWSHNEIETAKAFGHKYYLYLVDRDSIHHEDYSPEIISNPSDVILNNDDWSKSINTYYIHKLN